MLTPEQVATLRAALLILDDLDQTLCALRCEQERREDEAEDCVTLFQRGEARETPCAECADVIVIQKTTSMLRPMIIIPEPIRRP